MKQLNKIVPHFWFDTEASQASHFYLKIFKNSQRLSQYVLNDTPSKTAEVFVIEIEDLQCILLSAGPQFKPNPSISLMIACKTKDEARNYWDQLLNGGVVLMQLHKYEFSDLYGWLQDKYGVSWQIMCVDSTYQGAKIRPAMMFVNEQCGYAEKAMNDYVRRFKHGKIISISRYGDQFPPNDPQFINYSQFQLESQQFSVMDSAFKFNFGFDEGVSLVIHCDSQQEIDDYWNLLSVNPEAEQCGWLKDKYGVSWQVVPHSLNEMLEESDQETKQRLSEAILTMKKIDVNILEKIYQK